MKARRTRNPIVQGGPDPDPDPRDRSPARPCEPDDAMTVPPSPSRRPADAAPVVLHPDLPTRAGFDSDHPLASGLVGRDGPAISHLGDLEALLPQGGAVPVVIASDATGPWLLAMLAALAERRPEGASGLRGALCNDAIGMCHGPAAPAWSPEAALDLAADTLSWSRRALPQMRGARLRVSAPVDGDVVAPLVNALQSGLALLAATARRERPQHLLAAAGGIEFVMPGDTPGDHAAGACLAQLWQALLAERHGAVFAPREDLVLYLAETGPGFSETHPPEPHILRAALERREAKGSPEPCFAPLPCGTPSRRSAQETANEAETDRRAALARWRQERDGNAVQKSLLALREAAKRGINVMGPSVACAKAGVTTGEWTAVLTAALSTRRRSDPIAPAPPPADLAPARERLAQAAQGLARPVTLMLVRLGLDARPWIEHPVFRTAKDCGIDLRDPGARLSPAEITDAVLRERPHALLFCLGSEQSIQMTSATLASLRNAGLGSIPAQGYIAFDGDEVGAKELRDVMTLRNFAKTTAYELLEDVARLIVSRKSTAK